MAFEVKNGHGTVSGMTTHRSHMQQQFAHLLMAYSEHVSLGASLSSIIIRPVLTALPCAKVTVCSFHFMSIPVFLG